MNKKFLFTFFVVLALLAGAVVPALAAGPYDTFCAGNGPIDVSALPVEAPDCGEGLYFVIGKDGVGATYHDWESVMGLGDKVDRVYFMPGKTEMANPTNYPLEGAPDVFTELACRGDAALVYQSPDETGDGVTLSPYDPWGCEQVVPLFVVEPWYGGTTNADAGCYVDSFEKQEPTVDGNSLEEFASRTGWENGSAWVVAPAFADHPMVVLCSEVSTPDELGLNPNEHQILPEREDWVDNRALELLAAANMTLEQYCSSYSELLVRLVCPAPVQ